ncbi:MAG: hypothetical protein QM484_09685 [Woeseiaceae bacterium]
MNTPSLTANLSESTFDLRPAVVKKWVETLPMGSTGESSKQLYLAIKKVNQQENQLDQQLEFLEAITPIFNLLYPRLSQYFSDVSLPLDKKTRNVIHVTSSLLNEILVSYQSVLNALVTKKPFGWKKPFSLALHRTFLFSAQLLCTQGLSYQPRTKGVWHQIFWCYRQAQSFGLLGKCFTNTTNKELKTSLEFELKKLLLLSLLPANDLGKKCMKEVYNLMPLWIKNTDLSALEPKQKESCFTLNLLSDVPIYLVGTRKDKTKPSVDRHFLSTLRLKQLLSAYLTKLDEDGALRIGKNTLSKTTINTLLTVWSRNHLRQNVRNEGTGFVDIVTGLSAIHFVLNQQDQPAYDEASIDVHDNSIDFESTLNIETINQLSGSNTLGLNHFISGSDQEDDIWKKVYETKINEKPTEANWIDSTKLKISNFTKSILLDYSKDGYRLSVNVNKVDSLCHNELVAIREHALAPWALAQVKWLYFSELGDVQFGVNILSHHVLPVHVNFQGEDQLSKPLPCLLGLDQQQLLLFAPNMPGSFSDKKIQLEHQKQFSIIDIRNKQHSTTAFDAYLISEPKVMETSKPITNIVRPQHAHQTTVEMEEKIWARF